MLIHNAGTPDDPKYVQLGEMMDEFKLNIHAPIQISTRLKPFLEMWAIKTGDDRKAMVATISSQKVLLAGLRRAPSGSAVLKMMAQALKNDLGPRIQTIAIHPNWTQAPPAREASQNVPQIVRLLTGQLNVELNGKFLNFDGTLMPSSAEL